MSSDAPPEVVHFPPLPPLPGPPRLPPDPRQRFLPNFAARLSEALGDEIHLQANNTSTGFPASAVDLGRLKSELEHGLQRFDMNIIRERWSIDVRVWMTRLVFSWVQRGKELNYDLRERGVRMRLVTRDDLGEYEYSFDVFPGRVDRP